MKNSCAFFISICLLAGLHSVSYAQTVWNSGSLNFVKTAAGEKDCITPQTCLTRITVLYNDVCQAVSGNQGCTYTGPCNTEWAYGSIANWNSLTYQRLYLTNTCKPLTMIGIPMVVHLLAENIYLQVTFTSWQTGGGGFSYTRTTASAVPVLLSRFVGFATTAKNVLEWTSSSESNCSHYNIQRSKNGVDFTDIGRVYSTSVNGHSSTPIHYRFNDANAFPGHSYYRLEQWDKDGKKYYSAVVAIDRGNSAQQVSLLQNPASNRVMLVVDAEKPARGTVRISDIHGRILTEFQTAVVKGQNQVAVPLGDMARGIYIVQWYENDIWRFTGKIVKAP